MERWTFSKAAGEDIFKAVYKVLTFLGNWRSWGCAPSRVPLWNVGYFEQKQLGSVRGQMEVSLNFSLPEDRWPTGNAVVLSPIPGSFINKEDALLSQEVETEVGTTLRRHIHHTWTINAPTGLFPKNAIFSLPLRHHLCALFLTTKSHHSFGQLHFLREICMFSHDSLTVVSLS